MRKVFVGFVLLLSFIWLKSQIGHNSVAQPMAAAQSKSEPPPELESKAKSSNALAQDETSPLPFEVRNREDSQKNATLKMYEQEAPTQITPEQLAQEKLKIPIAEELKQATLFTAWNTSEQLFTGRFQGQVNTKEQTYLIRMNLMFDGSNYDITPSTCAAMYSSTKRIFRENYGFGNIKMFRTIDDKYIIISVLDRFYFQIFQTMLGNSRSFRTHLSAPGSKDYHIFNLNELPHSDSLDECKSVD